MSKGQYKQRITFKLPNGQIWEQQSIKRKFAVIGEDARGKHLSDNRKGFEQSYEGLQINRTVNHIPKVEFVQRDIIYKQGNISKYIGDTQDIVNPNLRVECRSSSLISGRDKQVKNKVANGELRRKRCEGQMLSFGVSKSKSYHKNKHKHK